MSIHANCSQNQLFLSVFYYPLDPFPFLLTAGAFMSDVDRHLHVNNMDEVYIHDRVVPRRDSVSHSVSVGNSEEVGEIISYLE